MTYVYDAIGRRVMKDKDGATTTNDVRYVYNGWQCVEEYKNNVLQTTKVYGNNIDELLLVVDEVNEEEYYFHTNVQGNVVAVSDNTGAVRETFAYDIYGRLTAATAWDGSSSAAVDEIDGFVDMADYYYDSIIDNEILFQGRRYDRESGLYYFRHRQYDPVHGSFLTRDPMGYRDSHNLYAFVNNNPIAYTDPYGLSGEPRYNNDTVKPSYEQSAESLARGERETYTYESYMATRTPPPPSPPQKIVRSMSLMDGLQWMPDSVDISFTYTFLQVFIPPAFFIEGSASATGCLQLCENQEDGSTGLMFSGSLSAEIAVGVGTSFKLPKPYGPDNVPEGYMYDPKGRGSKWKDAETKRYTEAPKRDKTSVSGSLEVVSPGCVPCETNMSFSLTFGLHAYAGLGVGAYADLSYTLNLYNDPGGWDFSMGVAAEGFGVEAHGYGRGTATGSVVIVKHLFD